jgi:uncharacterized protein YvpB
LTAVAALAVTAGTVATEARRDRDGAAPRPRTTPMVEVRARGRLVVRLRADRFDRERLRRLLAARMPTQESLSRGPARVLVRYDLDLTLARAMHLTGRGGRVEASRQTIAAETPAPTLRQAQRNTCESAALAILMATTGRRIDQRRLQQAFPRSGPPDPTGLGTPQMAWGDPDRGYVGRPDGGGLAGGFGVYPGPVQTTARRFGVRLANLTGQRPEAVYRALRQGRAVMAWVGLSDGPYGRWATPDGRTIEVNFGEHTVVLHGINSDGSVDVSNPLEGTAERWSREQFETMWNRLGHRALATL